MEPGTLPRRQTRRLQGYDYAQNGAYFVTICTYDRAPLFGTIAGEDVGAHLCVRPHRPDLLVHRWLNELPGKYPGVTVDSVVIMPDHIHVILVSENAAAPLPEIIKWFKTQFTNDYIHAVKVGRFPRFEKHLWQRGYYEHVIRSEDELNEIRAYIQQNPQRWAIKYGKKRETPL